jgi:hypothetical protein
VRLHLADGGVHECDVLIGATTSTPWSAALWGQAPKREHNLHSFGGFTMADDIDAEHGLCILTHSRTTIQGSWTSIRHRGRDASHGGC